jgi:AsmA protein
VSVSSRMQRFAIGFVAAVAIFSIALLAVPYLVSEQQIRSVASRAIQSATGVTPRIDGPVRLALLPRPAIQVQEIIAQRRLEQRARCRRATGKPAILAAPVRRDQGRNPHARSPAPCDRTLAGRKADRRTAAQSRHRRRRRGARTPGCERVGVASRTRPRPRRNHFRRQASLNWAGASLTTTGSFTIGNKLANGTLMIADTAALAKGQRSASASASKPSRSGSLTKAESRSGDSSLQGEGSLSADGRSLREALALFGISVPSPTGFGRFSVKSTVSLRPIALTFTNLSLELDGNRADGGLNWKRDGNRSILQGTLASETADLSIYQIPFRLTATGAREWDRRAVQTSAFESFDLDLRLSCGKLLIGKIEIGKAAITTCCEKPAVYGINQRSTVLRRHDARQRGHGMPRKRRRL